MRFSFFCLFYVSSLCFLSSFLPLLLSSFLPSFLSLPPAFPSVFLCGLFRVLELLWVVVLSVPCSPFVSCFLLRLSVCFALWICTVEGRSILWKWCWVNVNLWHFPGNSTILQILGLSRCFIDYPFGQLFACMSSHKGQWRNQSFGNVLDLQRE